MPYAGIDSSIILCSREHPAFRGDCFKSGSYAFVWLEAYSSVINQWPLDLQSKPDLFESSLFIHTRCLRENWCGPVWTLPSLLSWRGFMFSDTVESPKTTTSIHSAWETYSVSVLICQKGSCEIPRKHSLIDIYPSPRICLAFSSL